MNQNFPPSNTNVKEWNSSNYADTYLDGFAIASNKIYIGLDLGAKQLPFF